MSERHDKVIRAYVEESLSDEVNALAEKKNMTQSKFVRELVLIALQFVRDRDNERELTKV